MIGNTILHYFKVLAKVEQPFTQTTTAELKALKKYCRNALIAVEIGVFEGSSTAQIALSISENGILFGIDNFQKGSLGICYSKWITSIVLKRNGVSHKVKLIEKLSSDATADVPDELDFIFIDGDHSWDGIDKDWNNWSAKVKKGGIIALHDTAVPAFDPSREGLDSVRYFVAVIQHDSSYELKETIDSLRILEKIA